MICSTLESFDIQGSTAYIHTYMLYHFINAFLSKIACRQNIEIVLHLIALCYV